MDQLASETVALERASTIVLALFAAMALALAAMGIYGVLSYSTTQKRQEIGIRIALGAVSVDVLRMVMVEGVRLTVLGVTIGVAGALGFTRLLKSLLYEVGTTDTMVFLTVPILLACVALAACYVPARRATRVDPMVALRCE